MDSYISSVKTLIEDALEKHGVAVFENPTNIGKEDVIKHLINRYGRTLFISQSYDMNRQWDRHPEILENTVFMTYNMFSSISPADIYSFCSPYGLIIFDEAHHTGAEGYIANIELVISQENRTSKIFGITTHTKRYSDSAEDVADTVFEGHKINGISFEDAIRKEYLPQFDYISALYSLPKDIDDLIASSSLARKIISDSRLVQINEDGIKNIIRKHMPAGNRKVVYYVPSIEDSADAEKLAIDMGYGKVYAINYTKSDNENRTSLKSYNEAASASLVCISKFNEGAIPEGTNSVVILRKTSTINIFERQVLTALFAANEKPIVYDFVSNIDNLIYSRKNKDGQSRSYYAERISSLCSQSIVVDYARPWTSVFGKIRELAQNDWTPLQDKLLRTYYPKYGKDVYKYIKGHSRKECILRAEILGIEYVEKTDDADKEPLHPYTLSINSLDEVPDLKSFPKNFTGKFITAYSQTLDNGRVPSDIFRDINMLKSAKNKKCDISRVLSDLSDALIHATTINVPEDEQKIKKRQEVFKSHITGYAGYNEKKSENVVILNGKTYSGSEANEAVSNFEAEKKNEGMVLVDGVYMDKKQSIAGLYGETILEHTFYKSYWKMIQDKHNVKKHEMHMIPQFLKAYDLSGIVQKIDDLRDSRQPWSKEEEDRMRTRGRNSELYAAFIRRHSDLDILEKAKDSDNLGFYTYCTQRTHAFEKNYHIFIEECKVLAEEYEAKKQRTLEQKLKEEENFKKKQAMKKRMKNLKPTVIVVSGNKQKK